MDENIRLPDTNKEQLIIIDNKLYESLDDGTNNEENFNKLKEAGLIKLDYKTWAELRTPKKIEQKINLLLYYSLAIYTAIINNTAAVIVPKIYI